MSAWAGQAPMSTATPWPCDARWGGVRTAGAIGNARVAGAM